MDNQAYNQKLQEVFDRVKNHLLTQQKQALWRVDGGGCSYRTESGLRCAVGCLIPEEVYSLDLEGTNPLVLLGGDSNPGPVKNAWAKVGEAWNLNALTREQKTNFLNCLTALQKIHDCDSVSNWENRLNRFAVSAWFLP